MHKVKEENKISHTCDIHIHNETLLHVFLDQLQSSFEDLTCPGCFQGVGVPRVTEKSQ